MSSHVLLEDDLLAAEPWACPRTSDTSSSTSAARSIDLQGSKSYMETGAERQGKGQRKLPITFEKAAASPQCLI
jgi:hypothetical protein